MTGEKLSNYKDQFETIIKTASPQTKEKISKVVSAFKNFSEKSNKCKNNS